MRKIALCLAVLAAAALPTVAEAAKKGKKRTARPAAPAVQQPVDPNEGSMRLAKGTVAIFLPTWALPFYLSTPVGQAEHPNQNPHLLNPQGTQQQAAATTGARSQRAKR